MIGLNTILTRIINNSLKSKKPKKMSFWKTFLLSLLTLMVFTLLYVIIVYASFGDLAAILSSLTYPEYLTYRLLCVMGEAIWLSIEQLAYHIVNDNLLFMLLSLIAFIGPLLAAIVAGKLGDTKIQSLLSILLISLISMISSLVLAFNSISYAIIIGGTTIGSGALFNIVLGSLLNAGIFGLIAFLINRK